MRRTRNQYSFATLASIIAVTPALAQARDVQEAIVVTATKQGEIALAEYAGSVTVIDGEELEARAFHDFSDLSYAAPNVSLDAIGTFRGVANFSIRGLGINSSIPSIDPTVGIFIDGVYQGINAGTVFDMLDVERVEILRGTQGVTFGRNTTGGAVMVTTADPSYETTGYARLGYEEPVGEGRGDGMITARAVGSGALGGGFAVRLGVMHSDDGGYFLNSANGEAHGAAATTLLRGGLSWQGEGAKLVLKGGYDDSFGDGASGHNNGLFARDTFEIGLDETGFYQSSTGFVTLRGEFALGAGKLTNIFGWREYHLATRNDIDSTPDPLFSSDTATGQEQFSNELTYVVSTNGLDLLAGAYWLTQQIGYDEIRNLSPAQYGGGVQDHDVLGLFGQIGVELTPGLKLEAGARFSHEEKSGAVTYVRARPACSSIDGTCPVTGERISGENNGFTDKREWDALSPRLALSYAPNENALVYASWTRGHRSGGYNLRITNPEAFEEIADDLGSFAFDQEQVDTLEAGLNWQSADNAVFLHVAGFWTEVDGLQREVNVPSVESGLSQSIYNTADARILGGEVEATIRPVSGLTIGLNAGLTEPDYTKVFYDLTGDNVINQADRQLDLPRAPRATWGGSVQYDLPLSASKTLSGGVFFQHRDRFAYTDNNWGFNDSANRLDASLAMSCSECGLTLRIYGRNLLDEVQFGGDTQLGFAGGPFSDGNNRPYDPRPGAGTFSPLAKGRVLGAEIGVSF